MTTNANKEWWEELAKKVAATVPKDAKGTYAVGFLAGLTANYDFSKQTKKTNEEKPA